MWPTFSKLWQVGTNLPWTYVPDSLDLGFTQSFKQEFLGLSKQAVSTIIGLITREFILESETPKSSTIMPSLLELSEWIQSMFFKVLLENFFSRDLQIILIYSQAYQ
jgi:hypothetical protein